MSLSTHVLDATTGRPAAGVPVTLADAGGTVLASQTTDDDGRIGGLADRLEAGIYRLRFDTATYFAAAQVTGFYPEIVVAFEVTDATARYHVPVLLSPYAYSTYRGS
jgi:5-hydroxyisourate hydrolase